MNILHATNENENDYIIDGVVPYTQKFAGNVYINQDDVLIKASTYAIKKVLDGLKSGYMVYVSKQIHYEILPGDVKIRANVNDIDNIKRKLLQDLDNCKLMYTSAADLNFLRFYDHLQSMMLLASHGYFIHDGNREEKYIDIINEENEELINALERYLETKELYDKIIIFIKHHNRLKIKISQTMDIDFLTIMYKDFVNMSINKFFIKYNKIT